MNVVVCVRSSLLLIFLSLDCRIHAPCPVFVSTNFSCVCHETMARLRFLLEQVRGSQHLHRAEHGSSNPLSKHSRLRLQPNERCIRGVFSKFLSTLASQIRSGFSTIRRHDALPLHPTLQVVRCCSNTMPCRAPPVPGRADLGPHPSRSLLLKLPRSRTVGRIRGQTFGWTAG